MTVGNIRLDKMANAIDIYWGEGKGAYLGFVYIEVDGFYVWSPPKDSGTWSDYALRNVADVLTELNKDWEEQIRNIPISDSSEDLDFPDFSKNIENNI